MPSGPENHGLSLHGTKVAIKNAVVVLAHHGNQERLMMYQCIRCHKTWGNGSPEVDGYSHGLCVGCLKEALTPLYRKRQAEEGNFDCFARAADHCDQPACKYRRICMED